LVLAVLLFALLVLGGCVTKYQLRMRGVQVDPEQTMPGGCALAVDKVPEVKKVDRDDVVETKIVHLLEEQGYTVTDTADADYVLLYQTETTAVSARGTIGRRSGKGGMTVTTKSGEFQRLVRLYVVRAEPFRLDKTEEIIWSGTAVLPKVPSTSPRFEDLLLVGAFQFFNQDTGAIVTTKIYLNDAQAKELHYLDPVTLH
jgi:hypothetical protein